MALRLAAIYLWIQALLGSVFLFRFSMIADEKLGHAAIAGEIALATVPILLGAVLWTVSGSRAGRILGSDDAAVRSQDLATVAFRLIGIWLLDRSLRSAGFLLRFFDDPPAIRFTYGPELASFVLQIALWVILILGAPILARRGFPSPEPSTPPGGKYQPMAFSILAVVILADAIPELVRSLLQSGFWTSDVSNSPDYLRYLVVAAARVLLGLALFLGARPLARFWRWVQTAGLDRKSVSNA